MNEPTGYTALDMVGFTDKGAYNSSTAYVKNDIVHYAGNLWRCLVDDTTAVTPVEGANWTIFVSEPASAAEDIIAPVEQTATASQAYSIGDQLIYNDTLYTATAQILVADTLQVGTNITASSTLVGQLASKANTSSLANIATSGNSSDASYSNTTSGLSATTAQGAIDELASDKADSSSLGTAAVKDSTNAVTSNSSDLVESGAVYAKTNTIESNIAPVEISTTASQAYAVGDEFIHNDVLYKATASIAQGETITVGTNCTAADKITTQIGALTDLGLSVVNGKVCQTYNV